MNAELKFAVSQIIQNSEFWQSAQSALRFADSQLVLRRDKYSTVMHALLTHAQRTDSCSLAIDSELYKEFVKYWLRYVGKWKGGRFYHNCNFAENSPGRPRTKTLHEYVESFTEEGSEETQPVEKKQDKRKTRYVQPDSVILRALSRPPIKEEEKE